MSEIGSGDLGPVMAKAARIMHVDMDADQMLQSIVDVAALSVPGFDRASLSLVERRGRASAKAATDNVARDLDLLQYELGEGPCLDAMQTPGLVEVPHLRHEQRWPRYVSAAAEHGITAQLSVMLYLDQDATTLGGLNLYSTVTDVVSGEARAMAELFATQAAVALGSNRQRLALDEGMHSRQEIGQAIGLIMERYGLDEHASFQFLVRTSTTRNIKLRQIAAELVEDANKRQPSS